MPAAFPSLSLGPPAASTLGEGAGCLHHSDTSLFILEPWPEVPVTEAARLAIPTPSPPRLCLFAWHFGRQVSGHSASSCPQYPVLPLHSHLQLSSSCHRWIFWESPGHLCFSCSAELLTSAQRLFPTARAVRKFWGKEDTSPSSL